MTGLAIKGRARVLGDDINTDYIISSRRKRDSLDPQVLRQYLLESVDPNFAATVEPDDVLVAGENFGCGSAMEVAATVVVGAGIKAVLAKSFSRTYYRNAINNGLLPVICDTSAIKEGDRLSISLGDGFHVRNETAQTDLTAEPLSPVVYAIVMSGGLVNCFQSLGGFPDPAQV
ncbi:MAG: alpha-IPM isomerase [Hyphomicrobiaceae bacterium]|nr:alpha-IPM isomerase [Hyphomicrobiaceae bacterium]